MENEIPPPIPPKKPLLDWPIVIAVLIPVLFYALAMMSLNKRNSDSAGIEVAVSALFAVICSIGASVAIGKRRDAGAGIAAFIIITIFYGMVAFLGCTAAVFLG